MLVKKLVYMLVATLALPACSRRQESYEEDDDRNIYPDDDYDEDDDQDEEEATATPAPPAAASARRTPPRAPAHQHTPARPPRRPLDCYTCTYRAGQELKACVDPVKYEAYTSTCHSADDRCFTSVEGASEQHVEMIVRGCRSACVQSLLWSCCGESRCNNMTYQQPQQPIEAQFLQLLGQSALSSASPPAPAPTVHFFIGVLLLLHAALRVLL